MCEFCLKHGEGKKWYLRAENYSREMMQELNVHHRASMFTKGFNKKIAAGLRMLRIISKMPAVVKNATMDLQFDHQKKSHFGQVVPIEDVEAIFAMMNTVVRLPCVCRGFTKGERKRYCMGITIFPLEKSDEDYFRLAFEEPDLQGLEYLRPEEATALMKEFESEALIHSVWTLPTPFVVGICNCDRESCGAFKAMHYGARVMFRAEYVAVVDPEKCIGCRACVERCQFDALYYNEESKKIMIDPKKCFGCGICREPCPKDAISLIDRREHIEAKDLWY